MKMLVGVTSILAIASVGAIYLLNSQRVPSVSADPNSADFAAMCSVALSIYYVEGGKGPAFVEKSRRARYWSKVYHERQKSSGGGSDRKPMESWTAIQRELYQAHSKKGIEGRNMAMKEIMDMCAPHET
ncbi:MAG: hypothetical protein ACK6DM_05130 [Alphaproteobacteria bacterium]|jgi:hypothetical protein